MIDLHKLNQGKSSKFDTTWSNYYKISALDDRRHGDAVAMSIPDLKKKAVDKMPLDVESSPSIPSDEYVRLQFLLINKHVHTLECQIYWTI